MRRVNIVPLLLFALAGTLVIMYFLRDVFIGAPELQQAETQPIVVRGDTVSPDVQIKAVEKISVLVPTRNLPIGSRIERQDVTWAEYDSGEDFVGFITASSSSPTARENLINSRYIGAFVSKELRTRVPIDKKSVILNAGSGFLSALLPRGSVAISVPITFDTAVSGFVLPGDKVDIVSTELVGDVRRSRVLLNNVKVIAIDSRVVTSGSERLNNIVPNRTVTLELSERQALVLTESQTRGTLSLLLRSIADENNDNVGGQSIDSLENIPEDVLANQNKLDDAKKPIRVIRFGVSSNVFVD